MFNEFQDKPPAGMPANASLTKPSEPPVVLINDDSVTCRFNVMPDLYVSECLHIKEYRLWPWFIEGVFDRTYRSAMKDSPSHLIFLTMCIHTQKMLYVWLTHHLGRPYEPHGPELAKFWPTKIDIRVPALVDDERDLVHQVEILDLDWKGDTSGKIRLRSACGVARIISECPFFLVDQSATYDDTDGGA